VFEQTNPLCFETSSEVVEQSPVNAFGNHDIPFRPPYSHIALAPETCTNGIGVCQLARMDLEAT